MTKIKLVAGLVKFALVLLTIFAAYYLFYLKPNMEMQNKLRTATKALSAQSSALVSNRLAYINLTHLDPASAVFEKEVLDTKSMLEKTIVDGQKHLEENREVVLQFEPEIPNKLDYFYKMQSQLLAQIFESPDYKAGLMVIRSDRAVELLTYQTNLIINLDKLITGAEAQLQTK